jgi:hypothetical protein
MAALIVYCVNSEITLKGSFVAMILMFRQGQWQRRPENLQGAKEVWNTFLNEWMPAFSAFK